MSQNFDLGLSFDFMSKNVLLLVYFQNMFKILFSTFHKMKTRT